MIPIIQKAFAHQENEAVIDVQKTYKYSFLLESSEKLAMFLLQQTTDLQEECIAFMAIQDGRYAMMQWGIWRAGGIAVPLSISHPLPEIAYILEDTQTKKIIIPANYEDFLKPLAKSHAIELIMLEDVLGLPVVNSSLPEIAPDRQALIIYTSGTTNRPKGVVTTHAIITAQITCLTEAWEWTENDFILHILPLHHVHGIINVLSCALWAGAKVYMLPKFDAEQVWNLWVAQDFSLFMAVPTVYNRLISYWEKVSIDTQKKLSACLESMRLMVSGSAALPVSVLEKWESISGHRLLERYGMTEIGMAISNPLHGTRKAGHIGKPLPKVEVQLVDEENQVITESAIPGEIQIKSPTVFQEYWQKPTPTQASFINGWFCTGDIACRDDEGYYRILGRNSTDIIKTGGYKVSALEIEEVLHTHPCIAECAVVGIPHQDWGECIAVVVVLKENTSLSLAELRNWTKEKLAHYKVPTQLECIKDLPRNAMGKVMKPEVKKLFN